MPIWINMRYLAKIAPTLQTAFSYRYFFECRWFDFKDNYILKCVPECLADDKWSWIDSGSKKHVKDKGRHMISLDHSNLIRIEMN